MNEYNDKFYIKVKKGDDNKKIVSGYLAFTEWNMNKKIGISCKISDIKVDKRLDRYDDESEFCYENVEL